MKPTQSQKMIKKALVIGGSGGIGQIIVKNLNENGWNISILSRNNNKSGGNSKFYQADLRQPSDIKAAFEKIKREEIYFNSVINCAGVIQDRLLLKMSELDWSEVVKVNLDAAFWVTQLAAPLLEKAGGGHLIHLGSISGIRGKAGQGNYAAAKAGLVALAQSAARELGEKNIRVNVVLPGFLPTPMTAGISEAERESIRRENVLQRIGTAEEVARFVAFLCSTEHISGQVFNLDSRILPTWSG